MPEERTPRLGEIHFDRPILTQHSERGARAAILGASNRVCARLSRRLSRVRAESGASWARSPSGLVRR